MNEEEFRKEVKDWLTNSGKIKEFQSRLRKDLIEAIAGRTSQKNKNRIKEPTVVQSINSLVVEYLMIHGYWYSASVFVSEANFLVQPPDIEIVQKLGSETKRHSPSRISDEDILQILSFLNLEEPRLNSIRTLYLNVPTESLLSATLSNYKKSIPVNNKSPKFQNKNESVLIDRLSRLLNKGESLLDTTTTTTDEDTEVDETTRLQYLNKINEQNKTILLLNSELREAKRKLQLQEESQSEVQHLERIIENQKYEIFRLKSNRSASRPAILEEKQDQQDLCHDFSDYLARIRLKTLHLTTEGQGIDEEFSKLSKAQIHS